MSDSIDHPSHYNKHGSNIECIQVAEEFNFNLGNVIKYVWRAGLKSQSNTLEDLEKAKWYIDREISRLKNKSMKPDDPQQRDSTAI